MSSLSLDQFEYPTDAVEIAQDPPLVRGSSRLMVLDRASGRIAHTQFSNLPEFLRPGDLLVLNETKVFPARLRARRSSGGRAEILLIEETFGPNQEPAWLALGKPSKALNREQTLHIEGSRNTAVPRGRRDGTWLVQFYDGDRLLPHREVVALCEACGETPLPPYIRRPSPTATSSSDEDVCEGDAAGDGETAPPDGVSADAHARRARDRERYQTVYARATGAVAAPTAGLHFTPAILAAAEDRGVTVARLVLHVGLGTFQPLTDESFAADTLHEERLEISVKAGEQIRQALQEGRRLVAVGTTSIRGLETFSADASLPFETRTRLFIKPGYTFRNVDAVLTNFHLPRSSTLVLISAFAGWETLRDAYLEAIRQGYRFYSYGDAMLVV